MSPSIVPARVPASQAGFLDDLGRTLQAWRRAPLLPAAIALASLGSAAASSERDAVALPAVLLSLLLVGWPGAQRLWYLRLWTGRTLTAAEAWRATLRCFGRFFVLALAVGAVGLVVGIPLLVGVLQAADVDGGLVTFPDGLPAWVVVYGALMGVAGYALLTFVTPALTYSTKHVGEATRIGLRLLRVSWPRTAAYVLVPAVLASLPAALSEDVLDPPHPAWSLLTALVLALGRGATAAYYVRTVPGAGPDGAVHLGPRAAHHPPPQQW